MCTCRHNHVDSWSSLIHGPVSIPTDAVLWSGGLARVGVVFAGYNQGFFAVALPGTHCLCATTRAETAQLEGIRVAIRPY